MRYIFLPIFSEFIVANSQFRKNIDYSRRYRILIMRNFIVMFYGALQKANGQINGQTFISTTPKIFEFSVRFVAFVHKLLL